MLDPHEAAIIESFIVAARRERWMQFLDSPKKRQEILGRLHHCRDLDERFIVPIESGANVISTLKAHGAPSTCYVMSYYQEIDGKTLPLEDAIAKAEMSGWGTIIGCIPGELAYYYDETGERRFILQRQPASKPHR